MNTIDKVQFHLPKVGMHAVFKTSINTSVIPWIIAVDSSGGSRILQRGHYNINTKFIKIMAINST